MAGAYDILAVGYACVDYISVVDRLPHLDEKMVVDNLLIQGGGPSATAMVAASRLGARTALITPLGDDAFGREIAEELRAEGVDVSLSPVYPGGRSAFAFAMIDRKSGLRTIVGRPPVLPALAADQVDMNAVRASKVLFIDGNHPAVQLAAAREARAAGVGVVFDAGNEKPGMDALIPFTDYLIASRGFGRDAGGSDDAARAAENFYREQHVTVAAVTAGSEGAWFHTAEGAFHQPAFTVDVVDTTGAGDAFHGAYAFAVLRGWPARRSARFAAAVAALKCTKLGGRTGLPRLDEVERFLETH